MPCSINRSSSHCRASVSGQLHPQPLDQVHREDGRELGRRWITSARRTIRSVGRSVSFSSGSIRASAACCSSWAASTRRQPAEVLDEAEAQHDRQRPELAHRERRHVLVGLYEATEVLGVEARVGVGDQVHRQPIDARESPLAARLPDAATRARSHSAGRTDLADLIEHEVEVIQQPLGGRHGEAIAGGAWAKAR